jgi:hypothetical protein
MGAAGRNPVFKIRGFELFICETQITTQPARFAISKASLFFVTVPLKRTIIDIRLFSDIFFIVAEYRCGREGRAGSRC